MTSPEVRAAEIQAAIAGVLLQEWDPIGIQNEPQAQDEYDSYVGGVYRLLASRASAEQVAEHLFRIESEEMQMPSSGPHALIAVAEKLLALDIALPEVKPGEPDE